MNKETVEDDKPADKDEVKEKEQMSEEQAIEEEEDEDEGNDQTTNADLQSKQHVGTTNADKKSHNHPKESTKNEVNSKNGDVELHEEDPEYENNGDDNEEEDKPKDSDHDSIEMHSNIPVPDKYIDPDVEANAKICERNEQSSGGPHDEHKLVISKGNDYLKCDKGAENNSSSVYGAIRGRSSVVDVENSEATVEENKKEVKILVGNMESTERTQTFMFDDASEGGESGTEEEQSEFMKDLENLLREKHLECKVPKFYGVPVNLLKVVEICYQIGWL